MEQRGFPFEEIELERNNVALVSRVVRTSRTTDGAKEPCPDGPDRLRALRRLTFDFIEARPDQDARSKDQAAAWILAKAQERLENGRGKVHRDGIRDYLNGYGRWRKRTGEGGGHVLYDVEEIGE